MASAELSCTHDKPVHETPAHDRDGRRIEINIGGGSDLARQGPASRKDRYSAAASASPTALTIAASQPPCWARSTSAATALFLNVRSLDWLVPPSAVSCGRR